MTETARTRTFTWDDPEPPLTASRGMSGIEFFRAMQRGELAPPPIINLMDFQLGRVDEGDVEFTVQPQEFHLNPIGAVHGGVLCTLLDSAIGCAVHTTLPAGVGYTSIDLNVRYLRGTVPDSGLLTCTGTITKAGRRVTFGEAVVKDAAGRAIATATGGCLIIPFG